MFTRLFVKLHFQLYFFNDTTNKHIFIPDLFMLKTKFLHNYTISIVYNLPYWATVGLFFGYIK